MNDDRRSFATEIEIHAEVEDVWRALTEAEELMRWFPPFAQSRPGPGGVITLSWGEGLTGNNRILAWDPPRQLRTTWWEGHDAAGRPARALAVDFTLESRGERTVLRVVHSGFGTDASWDAEYDSISRGWSFELSSLRLYLERHAGLDRHTAFVRLPLGGDTAALWARLLGPGGLFDLPAEVPGEGEDFELGLPDGTRSRARLLMHRAGTDFAAVLDALHGGVLRLGLEGFTGRPELWFWLASWSLGEAGLTERLNAWRARIEQLARAA